MMAETNVNDLTFPFRRSIPLVPPAIYSELRESPPRQVSLRDGSQVWLVTRYDDVRYLLTDRRLSSDHTKPGFPKVFPVPPQPGLMSIIRMDAPDHGRLRGLLVKDFSPRMISAMRPGIEATVDGLLERMAVGPSPADLVKAFTLPLPSLVICQLLGIPYRDHEFFQEKALTIASTASNAQDGAAAMAELSDYLGDLIGRKQRAPGDDLLSKLVTEHLAAGDISHQELVALARLLLMAGHDTTAQTLGLSVLALLQSPDQLDELRREPGLIGPAVSELIRFLSVVPAGARAAMADVEVGGVRIRAGEGIILGLLSANHDERMFPGAGTLDIRRDARRHLAFGYGIHQCVGLMLARLEIEIALTRLFTAFPTLTLAAPVADIPFRVDMLIYGLYRLPVAW